jgi:ketosteroid isomerase-like protein
MLRTDADPSEVVRRLQAMSNAHDVDAIVACFAADYRNETPLHPTRNFVGNAQVRRNWTQILAAVPDISTRIVASAAAGPIVWTEWEHRGTRRDGTTHLMRGVVVFSIADGLIASARFFLEPVEEGGADIDTAVRRQVDSSPAP